MAKMKGVNPSTSSSGKKLANSYSHHHQYFIPLGTSAYASGLVGGFGLPDRPTDQRHQQQVLHAGSARQSPPGNTSPQANDLMSQPGRGSGGGGAHSNSMYNLMMAEGAAANCGMIMNPFVATLPSQSSDSDPTAGNPAPQQLLAPYYLAAAGATPSGGLGSSSVYSPYAQWPYLATPGGFLPQQFGGPGGSFAYGAYPMMAESQGFMGAFGSPMGGIDLGVPPCGDQHGPEGCNLFVFHIPNDMTHMDLYLLFRPYGNILSSRIMVDRTTCRSRGFGFVSYDNPASAQEAIRAMNGYQIGHKRLKVQHKRERERGVSSSSSDRGGSGRGRRRSAPAVTQGGSPHSPNALDKPEHTTALASHLAALEFGSAKNVSDSEGAQQNVAPIASVAASLKVSPTPYGSKHSSKHGSPNPVHACTEYKDQRLGMSKEVMA